MIHELGNPFLASDYDCMRQVLQILQPDIENPDNGITYVVFIVFYFVLTWFNPVNSLHICVRVCVNPFFFVKSPFSWVKVNMFLGQIHISAKKDHRFPQWNHHFSWRNGGCPINGVAQNIHGSDLKIRPNMGDFHRSPGCLEAPCCEAPQVTWSSSTGAWPTNTRSGWGCSGAEGSDSTWPKVRGASNADQMGIPSPEYQRPPEKPWFTSGGWDSCGFNTTYFRCHKPFPNGWFMIVSITWSGYFLQNKVNSYKYDWYIWVECNICIYMWESF